MSGGSDQTEKNSENHKSARQRSEIGGTAKGQIHRRGKTGKLTGRKREGVQAASVRLLEQRDRVRVSRRTDCASKRCCTGRHERRDGRRWGRRNHDVYLALVGGFFGDVNHGSGGAGEARDGRLHKEEALISF
jgi:hypothetical protein